MWRVTAAVEEEEEVVVAVQVEWRLAGWLQGEGGSGGKQVEGVSRGSHFGVRSESSSVPRDNNTSHLSRQGSINCEWVRQWWISVS